MGFFKSVVDFLSGGLGAKIVDKIAGQFPDRLSDKEKADIQAAIISATREHELKLLEIAKEQEEEFNVRIKELEGTTSDLKQFGFMGKFIVFLRGAQRPLWGYGVLIMDVFVFSGKWDLASLAQQIGPNTIGNNIESAFWVINVLVLGFLFGERAMRNVVPLFKNLRSSKDEDD